MKDDKSDFLKKHSLKTVNDSDISTALKHMKTVPSVVSLPYKKREATEDTEALESSTLKDHHHGKRGKKT